ncbi:dihydrodipicolinate synthase family protein [Dermabacter sp. HSID17554]|uniref:dihydrodipicolinate synthase family protein n=1 Tax=Dermabacter sp. HSID17554 TaxID=2419511 RepID=UPI000F888C25|nr:dihydrodipicolinate synthase family protein [Dermabacter sp. HSID17554]RUP86550.1 dihydrodipicolinate synthase family protein [Dermabacter sp. HSID17554]
MASQGRLTGVIPPLVIPLTESRELDVESLERLINHLIDGGVDGIFALGSSSEIVFHTDRMRERILEAVTGIVAGRIPVLAGVIDTETNRVLEHVKVAQKYGVAGVVATAPFYAITGPAEIERHFRILGEQSEVPVWAYDLPVCVHVKLNPHMLVGLGSEGLLAGVKDSSGDDVSFRRLTAMNRAAGNPLSVLTGHEVVVDGAYLSGADGSVPGLGNVDPAGYARMHKAYLAGDWETVRTEQDRLAALFEIVFQPVGKTGPAAGVGAFKTALRELGIFSTNVMSEPMTAIEGDAVEKIRGILTATGLRK